MNCDVCIGGHDYDYAVYDIEEVQAPGDCKCIECRTVISAGSICEESRFMEDEDEQLQYTCLPCSEIRTVYSCGETMPFGSVFEMLWECDEPVRMAGECWDTLSAAGKEKLLTKWRQWKGL